MASEALKKPSRGRPRIIPPIPAALEWRSEIVALEEAGALVAVELWRALRIGRLWAETPRDRRADLLSPLSEDVRSLIGNACAAEPGLIEALGTFTSMLRVPDRIEAAQVAEACHHVHEWADARGMMEIALYFAEAAATTDPENPARANFAARMCRRMVLEDRAAAWYQRGYKLAARERDRREVISALLGYGTLLKDEGRHDEARRFIDKAARLAANSGRRREAAECQHDLLCIAAEVGGFREAERRARLALDLYSSRHPRFPHLVHDFAFVLIRHAYYSPALPLLKELVRVLVRPGERVLVYGTLARAAGGARKREAFEEAQGLALQLTGLHDEFASAALVNVAEGALAFGEWERAEEHARNAAEIARRRNDGLVERVALELLARIAGRERTPAEDTPQEAERLEILTKRFATKLRKWKAPAWDGPEPA